MPSECFTGATDAADAPGATVAFGASDAVASDAIDVSTSAAADDDDDDDDDDDTSAAAHTVPSAAIALAASAEASATTGRDAVVGAATTVTCEAA
jgi:MoxR-like ATPase